MRIELNKAGNNTKVFYSNGVDIIATLKVLEILKRMNNGFTC